MIPALEAADVQGLTSVKTFLERSPDTVRTNKRAPLSGENQRPSKKPLCRLGRLVIHFLTGKRKLATNPANAQTPSTIRPQADKKRDQGNKHGRTRTR